MRLTCQQCGKRLSRKTARMIEGRVVCSTCMFAGTWSNEERDGDE